MTRWKSARLRGGGMATSYPPHYRAAFAFSSLLCPPTHRRSLRTTPASKARRAVGFTMLDNDDTNELAPASRTGSLGCPCVPCVRWNNRLRAFWLEPDSIFGSVGMTVPMAVHLGWAFHSACPSDRIDAGSRGSPPHGSLLIRTMERMLSRQLLTRPLPATPVPISYCGRNRRFVLRLYVHIEQSLLSHHYFARTPDL